MYSEYYTFGGVTLRLTGETPWQPSDICQPFRTEGGAADHTIHVTVTDSLPQPPENAAHQYGTYRWREGKRFCLMRNYGDRYAACAIRESDATEVRLSAMYRDTLSARVILESAGLFDLLADHGMLILHRARASCSPGQAARGRAPRRSCGGNMPVRRSSTATGR